MTTFLLTETLKVLNHLEFARVEKVCSAKTKDSSRFIHTKRRETLNTSFEPA